VLDGVSRCLIEPDLPSGIAFALRAARPGLDLALDPGVLSGLRESKAPDEPGSCAPPDVRPTPRWRGSRAPTSTAAASAGSRSSCRYLPGRFGVRYENLVHLGADGPELLNAA